MFKGQTALEYLMTYGWAILIVIIAIGALYALGLTKPCRWVGTQISGFTGGGFEVSTPRFDASDKALVFDLKRIGVASATLLADTTSGAPHIAGDGTYKGEKVSLLLDTDWTASQGDSKTVNFTFVTSTPTSGDCYSVDATINFTEAGRIFTAAGKISGTIEA